MGGGSTWGKEEFTASAREMTKIRWLRMDCSCIPTLGATVLKTFFLNLIGHLGASIGIILRDRTGEFQFWLNVRPAST